jgi:betaine-aldehyde dehydrogenase
MSTATEQRAAALAQVADFPTELIIDGAERPSVNGDRIDNIDPATAQPLASVAAATPDDVDAAVQAARAAFEGPWRRVSGRERGRLLRRFADLVRRDAERFAAIESLENGSPAGSPQIPLTIELFEYFAGWADKIHGTVIPTPGAIDPTDPVAGPRPSHVYAVREPVGVVAAIIPWNSPLLTAAQKLAPLLASGCTAVLKTAEDSMQAVLYLGRLALEAGIPPGVVNVINGGPATGAALVAHPEVDHVTFTGSLSTGSRVAEVASRNLKRLTLELGGKNPQIIFPDADLQKAAVTSAIGVVANQGQVCLSGSRILVHQSVHDEVVEIIRGVADGVQVGDPFEAGTTMGALISARHLERVLGYVESGLADGASLVSGGARLDGPGYFMRPTFFAGATPDMQIVREEIFGPVGAIIPFADEDEALALAGDTELALSATVWTSDLSTAHRMAGALRVGAVAVNVWSPLDAAVPHGGMRHSGLGRENGWAAIEAFTEQKTVTIAL